MCIECGGTAFRWSSVCPDKAGETNRMRSSDPTNCPIQVGSLIRRWRTGFSLIELLVVVAIIALLASMTLPGLARAREYAYFTSCKSSLRQIGISCLTYPANNKGRLPFGDGGDCGSDSGGVTHYRFGYYANEGWMRPLGGSRKYGNALIRQLYDDSAGMAWESNPPTNYQYIGKPRLQGRYLPIEALWDPIVKVREWDMGSTPLWPASDEEQRDKLARRGLDLGSGTTGSILGYALFLHNVGCTKYNTGRTTAGGNVHVLPAYVSNSRGPNLEAPFRWNTNSTQPRTTHKPSLWLAGCPMPMTGEPFGSWEWRRNASHFNVGQTIPGSLRFNIVHLDGHVHDAVWAEYLSIAKGTWGVVESCGWGNRPYGWEWSIPNYDGVRLTEGFPGAFDENR